MRCKRCGGLERYNRPNWIHPESWTCVNCGALRYRTFFDDHPELNVTVVTSMAALPGWNRSEEYLLRQFRTNELFRFVVRLPDGGWASNENSLTAAYAQFNEAANRMPRYPFTGGWTTTDS